jgi:hypothetical protein
MVFHTDHAVRLFAGVVLSHRHRLLAAGGPDLRREAFDLRILNAEMITPGSVGLAVYPLLLQLQGARRAFANPGGNPGGRKGCAGGTVCG